MQEVLIVNIEQKSRQTKTSYMQRSQSRRDNQAILIYPFFSYQNIIYSEGEKIPFIFWTPKAFDAEVSIWAIWRQHEAPFTRYICKSVYIIRFFFKILLLATSCLNLWARQTSPACALSNTWYSINKVFWKLAAFEETNLTIQHKP